MARKALKLFLRDCLYRKYLSPLFQFEGVEEWMGNTICGKCYTKIFQHYKIIEQLQENYFGHYSPE
jgi:hypothetical protein